MKFFIYFLVLNTLYSFLLYNYFRLHTFSTPIYFTYSFCFILLRNFSPHKHQPGTVLGNKGQNLIKMKKLIFPAVFSMLCALNSRAQKTTISTHDPNWLKLGIEGALPVGDISSSNSFALGGVLDAQWMANPNFGVGVASGYTHYFAKNSNNGYGAIPVGLLLRYYPKSAGFFAGTDVGYSFLTDVTGKSGGFYVKPELGYHNYHWNVYAFYNHIALSDGYPNLQTIGVGVIRNLRFRN